VSISALSNVALLSEEWCYVSLFMCFVIIHLRIKNSLISIRAFGLLPPYLSWFQFVAPVPHIDEWMLKLAQSSRPSNADCEKLEFLWVPASVLVDQKLQCNFNFWFFLAVARVAWCELDAMASGSLLSLAQPLHQIVLQVCVHAALWQVRWHLRDNLPRD